MVTSREALALKLEWAGERLEDAREERAMARAHLAELICAAAGSMTVTEIALLTGLSRPTVYAILRQC